MSLLEISDNEKLLIALYNMQFLSSEDTQTWSDLWFDFNKLPDAIGTSSVFFTIFIVSLSPLQDRRRGLRGMRTPPPPSPPRGQKGTPGRILKLVK